MPIGKIMGVDSRGRVVQPAKPVVVDTPRGAVAVATRKGARALLASAVTFANFAASSRVLSVLEVLPASNQKSALPWEISARKHNPRASGTLGLNIKINVPAHPADRVVHPVIPQVAIVSRVSDPRAGQEIEVKEPFPMVEAAEEELDIVEAG